MNFPDPSFAMPKNQSDSQGQRRESKNRGNNKDKSDKKEKSREGPKNKKPQSNKRTPDPKQKQKVYRIKDVPPQDRNVEFPPLDKQPPLTKADNNKSKQLQELLGRWPTMDELMYLNVEDVRKHMKVEKEAKMTPQERKASQLRLYLSREPTADEIQNLDINAAKAEYDKKIAVIAQALADNQKKNAKQKQGTRSDKNAKFVVRSMNEWKSQEAGNRDAMHMKERDQKNQEYAQQKDREREYRKLVSQNRLYLGYCSHHFIRGSCMYDNCTKDHGDINEYLPKAQQDQEDKNDEPDDLSTTEEPQALPDNIMPTPVQTHFKENYVPGRRRLFKPPKSDTILKETGDPDKPMEKEEEEEHIYGRWTVAPTIPKGTEAGPVNANSLSFEGMPIAAPEEAYPHNIQWGKYRISYVQYLVGILIAIFTIAIGVVANLWFKHGLFGTYVKPSEPDNLVELPTFNPDAGGFQSNAPSQIQQALFWNIYIIAWFLYAVLFILSLFQKIKYRNTIVFKRQIFMDPAPDARPDLNALSALKHPSPFIVEYEYTRHDMLVPLVIGGYQIAIPCLSQPPKQTLRVSWELYCQIANSRFIGFHKDDSEAFITAHRAMAREQFTNKDRYGKIYGEFIEEHTLMLTWGLHCEFKETTAWWDFPKAPV